MENRKCVSVKLCKFTLCHVKECNCKCKNNFTYIGLHNPIKKWKKKNKKKIYKYIYINIYIYIYIYMILHGSINQCKHITI